MYQRYGYHSQHTTWRNSTSLEGKYIGIEFECEAHSDYRDLLALIPDFPPEATPICECDGSLGTNGVEIIFPPMRYTALKNSTGHFKRFIEAIDGTAYHHSTTGMHMNVNTRGWTVAERRLFCAMIHNIPASMLRNLGGRGLTHYCHQVPQRALAYYATQIGHGAAEIKNGRIEVRFPKSTTDTDRIDVLVDFIDALGAFCKRHTDDADDYIVVTYQSHYTEDTRADYINLVHQFISYLKRSKRVGLNIVADVMENGYVKKRIADLKAGADSAADEAVVKRARPARAVA